MSDAPPPGGYRELPQQFGGSQPPGPPQPPPYQQQFQPVGAPSNSSGNGCLKAFLIVLAISTVLGVIAVVALVLAVDKVVDEVGRNTGVADAADYEVTFDADSCKVDDRGTMTSSGVLTNKANRRQAYTLSIDYYDETNAKLRTDSFINTGALDKDAKARWTSRSISTNLTPESITCKVSQVKYMTS